MPVCNTTKSVTRGLRDRLGPFLARWCLLSPIQFRLPAAGQTRVAVDDPPFRMWLRLGAFVCLFRRALYGMPSGRAGGAVVPRRLPAVPR